MEENRLRSPLANADISSSDIRATQGPDKMTKSQELSNAIERVGGVVTLLTELIERLGGSLEDKAEKTELNLQPSLLEVLTQGPARLNDCAEAAERKISELTEILF